MTSLITTGCEESVGQSMRDFVEELFPICRSITGPGVRDTLSRIGSRIPLDMTAVRSGTPVFDWSVPKEWSIRDAYIKNRRGERIVDFHESNLHVVNFSAPFRGRLKWKELRHSSPSRIHTLPEFPEWIPYRTTYYAEEWGFCMARRQVEQLDLTPDDEYEVLIDSALKDGELVYGECLLPGESSDEVLFSCHVCHPSLANDNLSGIAVAVELARQLSTLSNRKYTYRFLFVPGTIGAITWLSQNAATIERVRHGLVLALLGDAGQSTYKLSRLGTTDVDRAMAIVLRDFGAPFQIIPFSPMGYDERQYNSPGFNLPVGCLMRTPHARYPEYHSSADNLDLIKISSLVDSLGKLQSLVGLLEANRFFLSSNPRCEPQLGRRGLYQTMGGLPISSGLQQALLWTLNLSDGRTSMIDISERSRLPFHLIDKAVALLLKHDLLEPSVGPGPDSVLNRQTSELVTT